MPYLFVNLPSEKRETIAAADRNERIKPITTGLMLRSVPNNGRRTIRTSLVAETASEAQTAGFIPGRAKTSLARIFSAIRRSCALLG